MFLGAAAGAAQAATAGILPPKNPASDCTRADTFGGSLDLSGINACRALENVGPMKLPSNWGSLTTVQQGFVLINLERVNRGLPPIVGLSSSLSQLAVAGAANDTDPSFPSGGFVGGGAIWAEAPSVLAADYMWMYDDGAGSGNLDCTSAGDPGCWGHRDIILWDRTHGTLVAGGGYSSAGGTGSYAYVILSGYSTANLTFTWAAELRYFATKPTVEPAGETASSIRRHKKVRHRQRHARRATSAGAGPTISFG